MAAIVAGPGVLAAQHAIKGEFQESLHARLDPALVSYKPATAVRGEIRSVGADTMEELTKRWIAGFSSVQPGATFTIDAKALGMAVPALTDGKADIGPCAREACARCVVAVGDWKAWDSHEARAVPSRRTAERESHRIL